MKVSYEECPCCDNWSIKVVNGKIVRHERGLGHVPYHLYHKIDGASVKEQARRNLCPASGKTIETARQIYAETTSEKVLRKEAQS